ncbi:MAG: helix-turn-helix domain-containing protein [Planctomycetaceae bacterium]|nr:helix-turn-helix domain-containing protein [Planctomycetaceae bacterium]MCA9111903.1 helix-turn-helix domain-containing protein [Planctomycetaceae bacterium]
MEQFTLNNTGETSTETITSVAQTVARIHLQRELTAGELADVIEAVPQSEYRAIEKNFWTPPQLARLWGVSPDKVLNWIRSGELEATDMATSRAGRPRYRISNESIVAFQRKRSVVTPPPRAKRRRQTPSDVIEFF